MDDGTDIDDKRIACVRALINGRGEEAVNVILENWKRIPELLEAQRCIEHCNQTETVFETFEGRALYVCLWKQR
jgi:hypothetical protein